MKNALRAALLLLALLLLPGCTSDVPAAVLESPAPATATPEPTPAATPEPTPEPTPPATPYPGEHRGSYAEEVVILQQGKTPISRRRRRRGGTSGCCNFPACACRRGGSTPRPGRARAAIRT